MSELNYLGLYEEQLHPEPNGNAAGAKFSLVEHLSHVKARWPHFYDCIDLSRASEVNFCLIAELAANMIDFDSTQQGGRGDFYRRAQQNPLARSIGIKKLFALVSPQQNLKNLSPQHKILDVLGGDGVLARAMQELVPEEALPLILTSDLSSDMVAAAQAYGLFAIQQPAQHLLLKADTIDGVIIAYGTHHIPRAERIQACREAYRVLKPGGRAVLHDFEVGSPMSQWFDEVVDCYSQTGHRCPHFTPDEISGYFEAVGFANIQIKHLYDPFILCADSEAEVEKQLAAYILNMYGLVKLVEQHGYTAALDMVYQLACQHFRYDYRSMGLDESFGMTHIRKTKKGDVWYIEAPRVALVGCGIKPHRESTEKF